MSTVINNVCYGVQLLRDLILEGDQLDWPELSKAE